MSAIKNELALWQSGPKQRAVLQTLIRNSKNSGEISNNNRLEFVLSGSTPDYVVWPKTRLNVLMEVEKENGGALDPTTDNVSLSNLALHSLFRQVDLELNGKNVSSNVGGNYSYKAYFDVVLSQNHDQKDTYLQAEGYYKDSANFMDDTTANSGFVQRKNLIMDGRVDLEGVLHLDLAQQPKAILNGVKMVLRLYQHEDKFRLISENGVAYRLKIIDATLRVCYLKLRRSVMKAHNIQLKQSPALYPYWSSNIKTYAISQGSYDLVYDDIYHGYVPSKLILAFVSSAAYSGHFAKNPYNFHHYNANHLEVRVDGASVPGEPFTPKFTASTNPQAAPYSSNGYIQSYLSLFRGEYPAASSNWILRSDYPGGYAIWVFNIQPGTNQQMYGQLLRGNAQLHVKFDSPLSEPVTAILYAQFPAELKIENPRNVILS